METASKEAVFLLSVHGLKFKVQTFLLNTKDSKETQGQKPSVQLCENLCVTLWYNQLFY